MRVFSYLFHTLLALFMLAVSIVAFTSTATVRIGVLPWQGSTLSFVLLAGAAAGLVSVLLAVKRILPVVFTVWTLVVLVVLVRGYIFTSYRFDYGLATPLYLTLGAILAAIGGWLQFRKKPEKLNRAAYEERSATF
jgi:hypothetical protein